MLALIYPIRKLVSFVLFSMALIANAASSDFQLWSNITLTAPLIAGTHFRYWLETQERFGEEVSRLSQALVRPGVGYELMPGMSLWFGYAWIFTTAPFATPSNEENRIWQQLMWTKKYSHSKLILRTRLEERYLPNGPGFGRFRQLFKTELPLNSPQSFNLVASDEVFLHIFNQANHGFDQNRFFIGLSHAVTKNINLEVGYLNQFIQRRGIANFQGNYLSLNLLANY